MKNSKTIITVTTIMNSVVSKVRKTWTLPEHIIIWNNASPDWCTPRAENDLQKQGWQAILDNFKKYTEGIKFIKAILL